MSIICPLLRDTGFYTVTILKNSRQYILLIGWPFRSSSSRMVTRSTPMLSGSFGVPNSTLVTPIQAGRRITLSWWVKLRAKGQNWFQRVPRLLWLTAAYRVQLGVDMPITTPYFSKLRAKQAPGIWHRFTVMFLQTLMVIMWKLEWNMPYPQPPKKLFMTCRPVVAGRSWR